MKNLLTCPCCGGTPKFRYQAKTEIHGMWDGYPVYRPKGWEYSHLCPAGRDLQTAGGNGFATLHEAERDWQYKVGSFLRNPMNSFYPFIETGAELLTRLDDCLGGERLHLGDKVTLSRRSMTVRGVVQFIQRTAVGEISIILRDTDTIKFVIYTPVRERRKYMFSYHVERQFHWIKKPKGPSATHTIVDD
ncbi:MULTISPECIES: hypothetical protein [Bifidobacterium]|uniref:hypothetical protein n=1 Tax=Bifidobacterium TaxID=1678 RepID=UPI001C38243A|nr:MULTISPECIES: hypothetical protein [Bifidobacterium]MBV3807257.1 hypothetical protein [Bifidobacterium adolescentis]MBV3836147.1 hypothetical protein [Bifidobacterium sp. MSK.17.10]MCG4567315.1 hypothetical protein [Bifidobacterium adolescentis]